MSAQQPDSSSCGHRSIWIGRFAGSGPDPGSCPVPCQTEATMMSGGAGAPSRRHSSRNPARTASAVSGSPFSTRRSPSIEARRRSSAAARMPASAATWARRMPCSSAADLARLRSATALWSMCSVMPSARSRSATATGMSGSATASCTPIALTTREVSSSSSSWISMPASNSSYSPSSAMPCSTASGAAAAIRSASSGLASTCMRPSTSPITSGSMIATGSSCRIAAERSVSP